jgi:hypothetical protein
MENAASLFGLGAALFGLGFVVHSVVSGWLRLKEFERNGQPSVAIPSQDAADLASRLERIEQVVETTAVEIERIAEGQRYATRLLSEPRAAAPASSREPPRVITPH